MCPVSRVVRRATGAAHAHDGTHGAVLSTPRQAGSNDHAMRQRRAHLAFVFLAAPLLACVSMAQTQAAKDFGCSEDAISTQNLGDGVHKVEGCGKKDIYGYLVTSDRWVSLVERASFELSCPREKLTITPFAPRQMGVEGCSSKRVYVITAAGWVLDSGTNDAPVQQAAPPAAAPPAPTSPPEPQTF